MLSEVKEAAVGCTATEIQAVSRRQHFMGPFICAQDATRQPPGSQPSSLRDWAGQQKHAWALLRQAWDFGRVRWRFDATSPAQRSSLLTRCV